MGGSTNYMISQKPKGTTADDSGRVLDWNVLEMNDH